MEEDEKPPILKNWNNVYAAVIGFLVVLIILFTLITIKFQ